MATKLQAIAAAAPRQKRPSRTAGFAIWTVFLAGLLLQGFAPRLAIQNKTFVLPRNLMQQPGKTIDPAAIVEKERIMQLASGVFTLGGAIALAFWYRRRLVQALTFQSLADTSSVTPSSVTPRSITPSSVQPHEAS